MIPPPKPIIPSSSEPAISDWESLSEAEIEQLIAKMQRSHHLRSKIMNLETGALAETMEQFFPGFWSRFIENRRTSLKQFLEQKRSSSSQ